MIPQAVYDADLKENSVHRAYAEKKSSNAKEPSHLDDSLSTHNMF